LKSLEYVWGILLDWVVLHDARIIKTIQFRYFFIDLFKNSPYYIKLNNNKTLEIVSDILKSQFSIGILTLDSNMNP